MAEERFIMEIIRQPQGYYRYNYNPDQIKTRCHQLHDFFTFRLRLAADLWMETETRWLPKFTDLNRMVHRELTTGNYQLNTLDPYLPAWVNFERLKNRILPVRRTGLDPPACHHRSLPLPQQALPGCQRKKIPRHAPQQPTLTLQS